MPMPTDDPIRASDADREVVVDTLREAYMAGRLTHDEFDERMSAAYSSRTWGDLQQLTTDLPSQPLLGTDIPVRDLAPSGALPALPRPVQETDQEADSQLPARRRPVAILIPLAVWTLLVLHASVSPGVVFLLIVVFAVISVMASIRRR
jgi:hypothetical protein